MNRVGDVPKKLFTNWSLPRLHPFSQRSEISRFMAISTSVSQFCRLSRETTGSLICRLEANDGDSIGGGYGGSWSEIGCSWSGGIGGS